MPSQRTRSPVTSGAGGQRGSPSPILIALLFGALDGVMIFMSEGASRLVEAEAAAYAFGYELALGAVVLLVGMVAERASGRRFGASAIVVLSSLAFGALVLPEELRVRAEKLAPSGGVLPVWLLLIAALSLLPAAAVLIGRSASLARLWFLAPAGALLTQVVNHRVLAGHYPGIHLLMTVCALAFASASVWERFSMRARVTRSLLGFAGLAALVSLASEPRSRVLLELLRHSGISVAPEVAAIRTGIGHRREGAGRSLRSSTARSPTRPGLGRKDFVVLFLSIDAMRADLLPAYQDALPHLAAFAEGAVRFRNARSAANATFVALTALMTSSYYSQQHWEPLEPGGDPLPHRDMSPSFPETLKQAGVLTLLVDNAAWLTKDLGLRGFAEVVPTSRGAEPYAYADDVALAIRERLSTAPGGPAFLFAHFVDAHAPYDRAGSSGDDKARYVRELSQIDRAIGSILEHLVSAKLSERAVVIVTADHGEAFGEHGRFHHGGTVYEEVVRIPFWIRVPGLVARDVAVPVSLIDLGPTLVDLFGLDAPGSFMGESLVPVLTGSATLPPRPIVIDTGRRRQAMIFPNAMKVSRDLRFGLIELYDLDADPEEKVSLYDSVVSSSPELDDLVRFFDAHTRRENGYVPPFRNP